jgi:hypothetical protein
MVFPGVVAAVLFAVLVRPAFAIGIDKEPLVNVTSPSPIMYVAAGQTQAQVRLAVLFGSASNGANADPATFSARLTGFKPADLMALFSDVRDGSGAVIGKSADVTIPLGSPSKRYSFVARVRSVPFSSGARTVTLSDSDQRLRPVPVSVARQLPARDLESACGQSRGRHRGWTTAHQSWPISQHPGRPERPRW